MSFLFPAVNGDQSKGTGQWWGSGSALGARRASFLTRAPPVTF